MYQLFCSKSKIDPSVPCVCAKHVFRKSDHFIWEIARRDLFTSDFDSSTQD